MPGTSLTSSCRIARVELAGPLEVEHRDVGPYDRVGHGRLLVSFESCRRGCRRSPPGARAPTGRPRDGSARKRARENDYVEARTGPRAVAARPRAAGGRYTDRMDRPPAVSSDTTGAWPSRRTIALLLVLLAAAIAASYWVEIVSHAFNDVDPIVHVPNYDFFQYYAGGHNWNLGLDPYTNHPGVAGAIVYPRSTRPRSRATSTRRPSCRSTARSPTTATTTRAAPGWPITLSAFALLVAVAMWVTPGRRLELLGVTVLLTMASIRSSTTCTTGRSTCWRGLRHFGFLLYPRWRGWPSAALLALAIATKVTPVLYARRDGRLLPRLAARAQGPGSAASRWQPPSLVWVHIGLYREFRSPHCLRSRSKTRRSFNQTVLRFWWQYPLRAEGGLGARLRRAAVPGLRGEPQSAAGAVRPRRRRRGAARALRGAAAGGAVHAVLLAACLADGLCVAARAAGPGADGASAGGAVRRRW